MGSFWASKKEFWEGMMQSDHRKAGSSKKKNCIGFNPGKLMIGRRDMKNGPVEKGRHPI